MDKKILDLSCVDFKGSCKNCPFFNTQFLCDCAYFSNKDYPLTFNEVILRFKEELKEIEDLYND